MAQVSRVIQADPWTLAQELNTLSTTETIQIITKTASAGKFIIVSDNSAPSSQTALVVTGDPEKIVSDLTTLASNVEIISQTFSAAHYLVVYS